MEYPGFVGASYVSQAYTADQQELFNWYLERLESPGNKLVLYPTPGVIELTEVAQGPGRAHFFADGREFAVIGTTLWELDHTGTVATSRGTVALNADPATISSNGDGGDQLFITSGSNGYIYDLTANTLSQVTALNGKATQGAHLDGYFLALDSATSTFYTSNLLDGTTWDTGTDFAQRSIANDPWLAMHVSGRYVWLFGEKTSEIWYNTGASFPFAAHPSGLIQYGIAASWSAGIAGQDIIWLATQGTGGYQVMRAAGFTPERISSYPLETAVGDYDTVSDAVSDTYSERGHTFYMLSFQAENVTWAWDTETKTWHKRGTWDVTENEYDAWRPRYHVFGFGEHRMLDAVDGSVYRMSSTLGMDVDGSGIRRLRRAPAVFNENERIFFPGFELDVEPGLGLTSGQGSNPQVMLRWSDDGGKTWSSEYWRAAGKLGEYKNRARWNRLGAARRRVFEIVVSDPIPWRITGAYLTPNPQLASGANATAPREGRAA